LYNPLSVNRHTHEPQHKIFEELKQRLTLQSRTLKLGPLMVDRDAILSIDYCSIQSSRDRTEDEQYPKVEGEKD
jgi:hypothetical protein